MLDTTYEKPYSESIEIGSVMSNVYNWMALGLALTAIVALGLANSPILMYNIATSGIFYALIIGELILVGFFSVRVMKMSVTAAKICFFAYSALNGITLSIIFLVYTKQSIATTFFITAGTFAGMSAYGYKTKRDLSAMGSYLMMTLLGLIIASVVNLFFANPFVYWITSYVGVVLFTLLTAYDTKKIKGMIERNDLTHTGSSETPIAQKIALFGALILYLDFINLFLYLLRIFGRRD